jgi:hypothetical protein
MSLEFEVHDRPPPVRVMFQLKSPELEAKECSGQNCATVGVNILMSCEDTEVGFCSLKCVSMRPMETRE